MLILLARHQNNKFKEQNHRLKYDNKTSMNGTRGMRGSRKFSPVGLGVLASDHRGSDKVLPFQNADTTLIHIGNSCVFMAVK